MMRIVAGLLLGWLCACAIASAQAPRQVWEEFDKRVGKSRTIAALGDDLLGDRVALTDGSLSFVATDTDIPGSAGPAVAFSRSYKVKDWYLKQTDLPLADWDLEVPYIEGVFAPDWLTSSTTAPTQRCSITDPLIARARPPIYGGYSAHEYWQGAHLRLPGGGGGELLMVKSGTAKPTIGGPYYWVAGDQIYLSCIAANGTGNGGGEGFLESPRLQ